MKFQPDRSNAPAVLSYGADWVVIRGALSDTNSDQPTTEKHQRSLVLCSHGQRRDWDCDRFEQLTPAHFAQLADLSVEIVIFGSGQRQRFVSPAWLAPLMQQRVGIETMDMAAACRTYNILASEGRRVALALLLETADEAST
ncbi:MAG: hypothetical protein RLZZ24_601 [Pseudomonadota bacterium]|jgi:uncharacterized protein